MKRFLVVALLFLGSDLAGPQSSWSAPAPSPSPPVPAGTASPGPVSDVAAAPAGQVNEAVLKAESERIAVMAKAKVSVLAIFSAQGEGGGSGVVISADGYALTNFHVARPSGNAMKCGMADGKVYDAVVVGLDPTGDAALIKLFGREDFPHAPLADSDQVRLGDWVFAMGNPFLLATDFQPTVTFGIISGTHRYQGPAGTLLEYTDCLQTDASINPGNSGGPLFDAQGRLIGINGRASFEKRGRVNVGAAYAISIHQIKNFMGHLRSGRIVDHATLGARVGFDDVGRVVVTDILEQSDAHRRGLRYGDEIVSFAGRTITTPNAFKNVLGIMPKGWRVPLSFRREGTRRDVLVRLAGVHTESDLLEKLRDRPVKPPMPIPKPGEKPKPDERKPGEKPQKPPQPKPDDDFIPKPGDHGPMQIPRVEQPMPEVVKKHFEAKQGYANYYFNKLHRDRVWKAWTGRGDLNRLTGTWAFSGPLDRGGKFRFEISDTEARLQLPVGESKWTATDELGSSLTPPGSGGLLPTLHLWRRLALQGPGNFGELYYLGTAPLAGQTQPVDVLVGLHGGVECRFYFDPAAGHLLAVEMSPEDNVDPCEIYFSDYHEVEGRPLPRGMEVRFGDEVFGALKIDRFQFEKAGQP